MSKVQNGLRVTGYGLREKPITRHSSLVTRYTKLALYLILLLLATVNWLLVTTVDAWAGSHYQRDKGDQIQTPYPIDNQGYGLVIKSKEDNFNLFIDELAKKHGLDPLLVRAVIKVESDFEIEALSRKGAQGLMQLMPQTASHLGVRDVWNPYHNIEGGVKYLRKMLDRFNNNWSLALAAYNAGPNKVKSYGGIPPYPETQRFVREVIRYYRHYKVENSALYIYVDEEGNIFLTNIPKGPPYRRIY